MFIDSLSRWVEVVPLHADPTSEEVLDHFMTSIVQRFGMPRVLRSDRGSNIASRLCDIVLEKSGVDLKPSTAEHHQSVGMVERFNQTLIQRTRASDEGGRHWVDHLHFLLYAYRCTPHPVTGVSPALALYGRELRLPAQVNHTLASAPPASIGDPSRVDAARSYALNLHKQLKLVWRAALETNRLEQSRVVRDAGLASKDVDVKFDIGDRVVRVLPDSDNKLRYVNAGPYRIYEIVPGSSPSSAVRYKLRDLENRMVHDEFNVSNLRRYSYLDDIEDLGADEYVVDRILDARDRQGGREYRIKWRGHAVKEATWEPRGEVERRCADMVAEFEAGSAHNHAVKKTEETKPHLPRSSPAWIPRDVVEDTSNPNPNPNNPLPRSSDNDSDERPVEARVDSKDRWTYGRYVATPRGRVLRWFQPSAFLPTELESEHFENMRSSAKAAAAAAAATRQRLAAIVSPEELRLYSDHFWNLVSLAAFE